VVFKKGQTAWNKGIPYSGDQKEKQSLSMKGKPAWNKGLTKETDPRIAKYGITQSKTKAISHPLKGIPRPEEVKMKISLSRKGIPSPLRGIPRSDITKLKISLGNRGKQVSEETKKNYLY